MNSQTARVAVVTGAGRGLGAALMERFSAAGHEAVGIVRSVPADASANFVQADLSDPESFVDALEQISGRFGRIDFLFNNAALYPKSDVLEASLDEFSEAVRVNLIAPVAGSRFVLPLMLENGFGRVFNIGSWAHLGPIAHSAAYSASKGAVHAVTKAIAADLETRRGGRDVQIHEWIPGHLNTRMSDFTGIDPSVAADWGLRIAFDSPSDRARIYENDREWHPPVSRLQRLRQVLLRRTPE